MNYNCQSNKTLTATYSNASASCSVVSNYVPPVQTITFNLPISNYTLEDPNELWPMLTSFIEKIYLNFVEPYYDITDSDSLMEWTRDNSIGGYLVEVEDFEFPIDLTEYMEDAGDWTFYPIYIYTVDDQTYACEFEVIDEDTVIAKLTDNSL